ncbi:DUF397 domain-containing protein [Streptomyces spinosirectus]
MNGRPWPWRKARASDTSGNTCVEVRFTGSRVFVRHSMRPHGPHLAFPPSAWQAFVAGLHDQADPGDPGT